MEKYDLVEVSIRRKPFRLADPFPADGPEKLSAPAEVGRLFSFLGDRDVEELWIAVLNSQNQINGIRMISRGGMNTTSTHPGDIFRPALLLGGLSIILVHNHPSGSLTPSADDVRFTNVIRSAGKLLGIAVFDHIIVSSAGFVSFQELGPPWWRK